MNKIILTELDLKTFTEQDALDYCQLNNINPEDITELILYENKLTDISGIKLFKNLQKLDLAFNNKLKNISVIKDLNKLKILDINDNKITDISVLKNLKSLQNLDIGYTKIKDISVIQDLNNLKILNIINLKLEINQIQYINSCKNLISLYCYNGFKDMTVLKQLNKNIELW